WRSIRVPAPASRPRCGCRSRAYAPTRSAPMPEAKVATLVVDDEPIAREGLRHLLAEVDWIECIGEAANGLAAVEAIETLRPELVFLDVQMPGLLGTEVLRRVSHVPFVVFTTA